MARQRQVSKNIITTKATILTFNLQTMKTEDKEMTFRETDQSKVNRLAEKAFQSSKTHKFLTVKNAEQVSEYRAMPEEKFFMYGSLEKPNEAYISRTIKANSATVLYFNMTEMKTDEIEIVVTGDTSEKAIEREFSRLRPKDRYLTIKAQDETEIMVYMTEVKFIEHSQKVEKGQSRLD